MSPELGTGWVEEAGGRVSTGRNGTSGPRGCGCRNLPMGWDCIDLVPTLRQPQ